MEFLCSVDRAVAVSLPLHKGILPRQFAKARKRTKRRMKARSKGRKLKFLFIHRYVPVMHTSLLQLNFANVFLRTDKDAFTAAKLYKATDLIVRKIK